MTTESRSVAGEEASEDAHHPDTGSLPLVVVGEASVHISVERPSTYLAGCPIHADVSFAVEGIAATATGIGVANGVTPVVIAVQSGDGFGEWCRQWLRRRGVRSLLLQRLDAGPRVSVSIDNKRRGTEEVYTQTIAPLSVDELSPEMCWTLQGARVLIVGSMRLWRETWWLLLHLPDLAPDAYRALIVDESLVGHYSFVSIALGYQYVQVSASVSRLLHGGTNDLVKNALRLRYLTGGRRDCVVIDVRHGGWAWCDGSWWQIEALGLVRGRLDERRTEELFGSAFVVGRRIRGLDVAEALDYAVHVASSAIRQ